MRVKLWGTRGSVPTPNLNNKGYGGNTPCVEIITTDEQLLILDGGMGLHWLGRSLLETDFSRGSGKAHLLLSHTHWDHIQGIPFFTPPMLIPGNHFVVYGCGNGHHTLDDLLRKQMDTIYCPVPNFFNCDIGAKVEVREVDEGAFEIGTTHVQIRRVNHVANSVCLGYRLENGTASLAYLPNVEYLEEAHLEPALELARDVDLLIHDAYFTTAEYAGAARQGHSCDGAAVDLAETAGVRHLLLFNHHPDHCDDTIDAVVKTYADRAFPVAGAREGAEYTLGSAAD